MIADLKPYPEYKDSESPWLGRVPIHWNVVRLGSIFKERRETNDDNQISQVLSVLKDVGVIRYEDKGNIGNKKSDDIRRYKIVRPEDIVLNSMNVIIGSVGRSRLTGCLSPVYYVLSRRSELDEPRYLEAVFKAKPFQQSLVRIGNGILAHRMRIPMELLKCELFPAPPPSDQAAIVRFLDWANGRLERAIRAKRKVIALLSEQKQAVIHRTVTRGLDPSVPLNPTGIPWLGKIPQHWELVRLKYISPQITVGIVIQPARLYVPNGVACLRSLNISSGKISTEDLVFISTVAHMGNAKSELRTDDLAIVRTGRAGIAVIVPEEFNGANCVDLLIVRKSRRLLSVYLLAYLQSYAAQTDIAFNSVGAIQAHYNTETLANLRVPLPSIQEQDAIVRELESQLNPLNAVIERTGREIEYLLEYRNRLVSDVVTGKLDVREASARLPDTTEPEINAVDEAELDPEAGDEEVVA